LDVGSIGFGGLYEKIFTLDISKRIQSKLIQAGATGLMPIQTDQYLSLSARTMFANRNGADFFLSVHLNSSTRADIKGTETYYYKEEDLPPARIIHEALLKHLKQADKGVRKARYFVLFHTTMPAVLIEPAYLSNLEQYNLLLTDDFKNQIVDGVVEGILKYYEK
ncbi:MAG: N-acetylmuramoyl-L-alanine amidase, partial [Candidatus Margulisiibacteriota bacterium]